MEGSYKKSYTVTTNMLDCRDTLKLSSVFDLAQEIAGDHANILGCGYNDMFVDNKIWVVARHFVEFNQEVINPTLIDVLTYPCRPRIIEFPREYVFSKDEEVFAHAISSWMVFNTKTNAVDTCDAFKNLAFHEPYFTKRVKKLEQKDVKNLTFFKDIKVTYSMLDHNGHMNNTHYFDFYLDAFKPKKIVKTAQIEYISQAFLDETLKIYTYSDSESDELYGYRDGTIIFYLRVTYFEESKDEN